MDPPSPGVAVRKPVSVWNQPLKADFKALFKSLSKAVVSAGIGKWPEAGIAAAEALTALGLETDPGQVAWLLVRRALTQAVYELVGESARLLAEKAPQEAEALCGELDLSLEENEWGLDGALFERPMDLPVLEAFKRPLAQWLVAHGMEQARATTVADRLPSYFVFALHREWGKRPEQYVAIREAVATPFTVAAERERAWMGYSAWLQKQVDGGLFGATFSLRQMHVPLRAYYEVADKARAEKEFGREERPRRMVVDLEHALDAWLQAADPRDAVRVVTGGPGSGKTTRLWILAARWAAGNSLRLVHVPLHQLDVKADLEASLGDFVETTGILPTNPLDPSAGEPRLLLIFDGLDELAMQGKVSLEAAQQFVAEVVKTVATRNHTGLHLQALLAGRTVVVQAMASTHLRKSA